MDKYAYLNIKINGTFKCRIETKRLTRKDYCMGWEICTKLDEGNMISTNPLVGGGGWNIQICR